MTETCLTCGGVVEARIEHEHVEDLGGVKVLLIDAFTVYRCRDCHEELTAISDAIPLAQAAALARVMIPVQLTAKEIRFLRTTLDMTQAEFAEAVSIDSAETISRWESGARGHGAYAEKLIRYGVHSLLHKLVPAADSDPERITRMKIRVLPDGQELPPIPFRRIVIKQDHRREEGWDTFEVAA